MRPIIIRCRSNSGMDLQIQQSACRAKRTPACHISTRDCGLAPAAGHQPCAASEALTELQGRGGQQRPEQAAEGLLPPPWRVTRLPGVTSRAAQSQGGCGEALETKAATSPWLGPRGLLRCRHSSSLVPARTIFLSL